MDSLVRPLVGVVLAAAAESTFWDGFLKVAAQSNIPHTPEQFGATLAVCVGILASQAWQWWSSRNAIRVHVARELAAHLASYRVPCSDEEQPASGPATPGAASAPLADAV